MDITYSSIPTADLSPFFDDNDDEEGKKKATETISRACSEYGFFQIVNHGIPTHLTSQALDLSKEFFGYDDEEKLKCRPKHGGSILGGYSKQPPNSPDKNDYLLMLPPGSDLNAYPQNPPQFREVLQEIFAKLSKLGSLVESILNDSLDLAPNTLKEYNSDRSCDLMAALHYIPATNDDDNGISEHEDGNCVTFVLQDELGGLEVLKNQRWIPITPTKGALVVNVGDVLQVLSNKRLKSATHRVVRTKGQSRHSFAYFYNLHGDKWVEPLPEFTREIGESPKYRGFFYKDYQELRIKNKTHPPSSPQHVIHITHYAITHD